MAKFPTETDLSVTVAAPKERVYAFLWDVVGSSACIPGLDRCEQSGPDTYVFVMKERSVGPVSMAVRYTAAYKGDGSGEIRFEGIGAEGDNTDVNGLIRLGEAGPGETTIRLHQVVAPDSPVPRLVQGLVRSFVESEAKSAVEEYLQNVKATLER